MSNWQQRFIDLATHIATWSKDPSTRVGAVIVDDNKRIVSVGFNGPPRFTHDNPARERPARLLRTLHAEENAILFAGGDLSGCALYSSHHPCAHCAAQIIQVGIAVVRYPPTPADFSIRWYADITEAQAMFREAGVDAGTVI